MYDATCEGCVNYSGTLRLAPTYRTREERDALIELGCDLRQGYLFARPELPFPQPDFTN